MTGLKTYLSAERKIAFPAEVTQQLGLKNGDTFNVYSDSTEEKIFLVPKRIDTEAMKVYAPAILSGESCVVLPQELVDELSLSENEVLSIDIDETKNCLILEPIPPTCVFCGELGDRQLNGKYICRECVEKISLETE